MICKYFKYFCAIFVVFLSLISPVALDYLCVRLIYIKKSIDSRRCFFDNNIYEETLFFLKFEDFKTIASVGDIYIVSYFLNIVGREVSCFCICTFFFMLGGVSIASHTFH